jgi:hypothetical protein
MIARDVWPSPWAADSAGLNVFFYRLGSVYRNYSLYGYTLKENREYLITLDRPLDYGSIASDGKVVVWSEREDGRRSIWSYNLGLGTTARLFDFASEASDYALGLAIDGSTLYYERHDATMQDSLYSRQLTPDGLAIAGEEELIAENAGEPVAAHGVLLWRGTKPIDQWTRLNSLHMRKLNTIKDRVIFSHPDGLGGYSIWGDKITFAISRIGPVQKGKYVYLYDINKQALEPISPQFAERPIIRDSKIIWYQSGHGPCVVHCGEPRGPLTQVYDIDTKATSNLLNHGAGNTGAFALIKHNGDYAVAYTKFRDVDFGQGTSPSDLYLMKLEQGTPSP